MNELEKLQTEIKVLNKRVAALEHRENKRNAFKKVKFIFNLLLTAAFIFCIWYGYNYITNTLPNQIKENITDLIPNIFQ